jgi:magnesium transporter
VWRSGTLEAENLPNERLSDYLAEDDCLVWADVCDPDHQDLQHVAEELGLHPAAVEDAVAHNERAKATRYSTHTFLTAHATTVRASSPSTTDSAPGLQVSRVSAFVLPRGMVTVRTGSGFDIDEVVRR